MGNCDRGDNEVGNSAKVKQDKWQRGSKKNLALEDQDIWWKECCEKENKVLEQG